MVSYKTPGSFQGKTRSPNELSGTYIVHTFILSNPNNINFNNNFFFSSARDKDKETISADIMYVISCIDYY